MKYELDPIPWSLASNDGALRKINKAALSGDIEKLGEAVENNGKDSAYIIDVMTIVQKTVIENKTFSEISKSVF